MSSRLKERGGGGGKIMASKPQKALTESTPKDKGSSRRTSIAGKENPITLSTVTGKPSAFARRNPVVPGVRWSTSSIPVGKAPNPSDLCSNRLIPRVSVHDQTNGTLCKDSRSRIRVLERCQQGKRGKDAKLGNGVRVSENQKPNALRRSSLDVNSGKSSGRAVNGIASSQDFTKKDYFVANPTDGTKVMSGIRVSEDSTVETCKEKACLIPSFKTLKDSCEPPPSDTSKFGEVSHDSGLNCKEEVKESTVDCIKVFENKKEETFGEMNGDLNVRKYPSRLHEKLAVLEGRVQRIASDIKRTKEMLDQSNQDESKLILSDIQKKISGIEKAVGCVMDGTGSELQSDPLEFTKDNNLQAEPIVGPPNSSVKGLDLEELEARFFPHQKLIKNRTSVVSSGEEAQSCRPSLLKLNGSMSPIDENPIALEFLASLNTDKNEMKKNGRDLKLEIAAVREMGTEKSASSGANCVSKMAVGLQCNDDVTLMANEKLEDFDDQENKPAMTVLEEGEDSFKSQLFEIGCKVSTAGWFVSEGEAVLLVHNDGSCSYYDIANSEEKAKYKPPKEVSSNLWGDCWLIRAPGADGCSGRYVVAASAGNTLDSGFCSWDFYTKKIQAFRVEDATANSFSSSSSSSRIALAPLTNTGLFRRSASCIMPTVEGRQWWYKPCGPLMISTSSRQNTLSAYDIRDGDLIMKWEVNSPVAGMEYSSPLQWRSRGKVVVAENEAISLWDVNSLNPQPLLSVSVSNRKVYCLHVNNTDAEIGGGVRQRVRSSEVEGNDGVFCTQDCVNVFDFRLPSGVGLKIPRQGANAYSVFSCGDSIFVGSTDARLSLKNGSRSRVQHFSLRKGRLITTYMLPDSNSHSHHSSISQVWGNSNLVMGICGMGLSVFDALKDESLEPFSIDHGSFVDVKETIGPNDLYCPTFDYSGSRVLIISRDRPALWRYLF